VESAKRPSYSFDAFSKIKAILLDTSLLRLNRLILRRMQVMVIVQQIVLSQIVNELNYFSRFCGVVRLREKSRRVNQMWEKVLKPLLLENCLRLRFLFSS